MGELWGEFIFDFFCISEGLRVIRLRMLFFKDYNRFKKLLVFLFYWIDSWEYEFWVSV